MEQFQEQLQGEPSEDPLWTSPTESENISDSDVAEQHFGEEPPNLEEYMQTEEYIQECFPLEQSEQSEQSENNSSDIDTDEIYSSDESVEMYMSEVDLSTEPSDISDGSDAESDSNEEDPENEEDEEERRQNERHRRRIFNIITQWMAAIYQERLEEEVIYVKNNSGNIDWTDDRFIAFRLLCRTQIEETIQQLEEGSILCPLSQENTEE